ncbi:MAG: metal ABC transporter permease [Planctomycetes bacterium]|nr:metal ABC transporter permease [Planctomycetota bacterium]
MNALLACYAPGVVPQSYGADYWLMFGDAILVGLLLATALPLLGVVLVLRHQVFLAAAIGQSANFGIAFAMWAGLAAHAAVGHSHEETMALGMGLAMAVLTAVVAMRALSQRGSSLEASAVWIFLFAGTGAMLLLANAPHGLQEVQRLMLSSLLGASPQDVYLALLLLLGTLLATWRWRRRLLLWAMDPGSAQAYGSSVLRLDLLVGAWLGLGLGFAMHATGLTFTFGCAILPVLFAREVARSLAMVLWLAPLAGFLSFVAGFVLADRWDLPPGQCAVAVQGSLVLLGRLFAWAKRAN